MVEEELTEEIRKFKAVTIKYRDLLSKLVEGLREIKDDQAKD